MSELKYAKIIDSDNNIIVGEGTNVEYYKSLGMELMEVEQNAYGMWQLSGKPINTDDIDKAEKLNSYLSLLNKTDWYVTRFIETGKEIPEDIKLKRMEAREMIDSIKGSL